MELAKHFISQIERNKYLIAKEIQINLNFDFDLKNQTICNGWSLYSRTTASLATKNL